MNKLSVDQKLIIFFTAAALITVLSLVAYNIYDSTIRVAAHNACVENNKELAQKVLEANPNGFSFSSLPMCAMR